VISHVEPPCIGCVCAEAEAGDPELLREAREDAPRALRHVAQRAGLAVLSLIYSGDATLTDLFEGLCPTCKPALAYAKRLRAERKQ